MQVYQFKTTMIPYGNQEIKVFFRINSYILRLINSYTNYTFMFWIRLMRFKCIDDLKGSRVKKTHNVAKAKSVRSSINLLT